MEYTGPSDFVPLHVHSQYSPLDGVATPQDYAIECNKRGWGAMALTEHGNMASVPDAVFAFKKNNIKFIYGCELYYCDFERHRQELTTKGITLKEIKEKIPQLHTKMVRNRHLTVLAKNDTGVHNLIKLTSLAYKFGFYYKPRIWLEKLLEFKDGLIVLSGCLNGPMSHELRLDAEGVHTGEPYVRSKLERSALDYAKMFKESFGDDFYIELQMPCLPELYDYVAFHELLNIADMLHLRPVLTCDTHYMTRDDFQIQKIMMAIDQKVTVDDPNLFHVNSDEQYFKQRWELWDTFRNNKYSEGVDNRIFEEMCDNTLLVADKCENIKPDLSPKMPYWSTSDGTSPNDVLRKIVAQEIKKRNLHLSKDKFVIDGNEVTYLDQAKIELDRIIHKGFASYFLTTRDLIQYGRSRGYPFGSRGSAAGSLICYLLGISNVNPCVWDLSFDRFLSAARGGYMLDIKVD